MIVESILEKIPRTKGSSFRLLDDPKLHDFYYWHFHPEIELVYIEGVDGERHVGSHSSKFYDGDLVLIGTYIPHLNFDYGVKGEYYKTVLQMDETFLLPYEGGLPELKGIRLLLKKASHGIVFSADVKRRVGAMMKELKHHQGIELLNFVLRILDVLANDQECRLLHILPYKNSFYEKQQERFRTVIDFLEMNYGRKIKIKEIAAIANYSEASFCRYFKKITKLSFTTFLNNYRIDIAKRHLKEGMNVTEAAFSTGFESVSYFNKTFKKVTGVNPSRYASII